MSASSTRNGSGRQIDPALASKNGLRLPVQSNIAGYDMIREVARTSRRHQTPHAIKKIVNEERSHDMLMNAYWNIRNDGLITGRT